MKVFPRLVHVATPPSPINTLNALYSEFEKTLTISNDEAINADDLTHFNGNKLEPIHRWFVYKEGFSFRLLNKICKLCNIELDSLTAILDPYTGVGTSLLSAQLCFRGSHELKLVGIERNPFVASVARTKLNWHSVDATKIRNAIPRIVAKIKGRGTAKSEIPELSTLRNTKVFDRRRLYDLMYARQVITTELNIGLESQFFLLGWAAVIEAASNVRKDGRALRFVDKDDRPPVHKMLESRWRLMLSDLLDTSKVLANVNRGRVVTSVFDGDGRSLDVLTGRDTRFDLILYSPPYLNNLDYSEVYKMELWLSGAINSGSEFRRLRLQTLRSHPSVAFPDTRLIDHLSGGSWCRRLRDALIDSLPQDRRAERTRTIRGYLDDMLVSLRNQYLFAQPGAPVVCVIGNSVHGKKRRPVPVATDLLIASIAKEAGFVIERLHVMRHLRRRDYSKRILREGILILRRPVANRNGGKA